MFDKSTTLEDASNRISENLFFIGSLHTHVYRKFSCSTHRQTDRYFAVLSPPTFVPSFAFTSHITEET